jgi:hypothetical protein
MVYRRLGSTILTAFCAHLTNYCHAAAFAYAARTWEHPYIEETKATRGYRIAGMGFHVIGLLAALAGLVLFVVGM